MKVYFYIRQEKLEYLNNILKDYNNLIEPIEISFNPMNDSVMVSLLSDDFIGLSDRDTFATLISL
jgi:hypothetical protein|tara:strand:- start:3300 stop:3494 length:195 start_codon:yes stop_codon:yes gene_type:complete